MIIISLNKRLDEVNDNRLKELIKQFDLLITELNAKELPDETVNFLNKEIEQINISSLNGKELRKLLSEKQSFILKRLEKHHKMVPRSYYRNQWLIMGMVFGVAIGISLKAANGHLSFLGLGIVMGMAIGYAIGDSKDKKALSEGRLLNIIQKNTFC